MKDIEINSDKITVFGGVFLLALALFGLFFDLHALASHRLASHDVPLWEYPFLIFSLYVVVNICREPKLRKNYPFGVVAVCLMGLGILLKVIAHWESVSPWAQNFLWTSMKAVEIVAWGLILVEGVRWFRKNVVLT
jgi:hypothetical protein